MEPKWRLAMGVNLSIKNVPAEKVELLKQRAKRNHRSLQGELLALVDEAVGMQTVSKKAITIDEFVERARKTDIKTPDESTAWIRELRDSR
jgi:plasmid stability protein